MARAQLLILGITGSYREVSAFKYQTSIYELTPLTDYRKSAISLILTPYFVNVQELSDADSFDRTKEWVLRCNEVRKLEPSVGYFDELINNAVRRVRITGIKPLNFEDTLRYKNQELYDLLRRSKG